MGNTPHPWEADGPPPDPVYVPLSSPRAGEELRGVVLSHKLKTVWVHYDRDAKPRGRTVPCCRPADQGHCATPHCPTGRRLYYGYLVWSMAPAWQLRLLELPTGAIWGNPGLVAPPCRSLRGLQLAVKRQPGRHNGPVSVRFIAGSIDLTKLPEPPDIAALLLRLWGLDPATGEAPPPPNE